MNGLTLRSVYDKDLNKEDGAGKTAPFSLDRGSSQLKESSFKNGKVDFNFVTNPAFAKEAKTELNNLSSELANKKAENEKLNEFYNSRDGEKSQTAIAPAGGIKAQSSDGKPVDTTAKQTILSANAKSAIEEFRNTTQATYNSIKQRAEDAQNRLTGVQNDILNDIQNNSFTTPKEALAVTGQKAKSLVSAVQDQKAKQKILDQYDYIKEYDNFTTDVNTGNIIKDKVNTAKANYTVGRISQDQSKAWSDYLNNPTKENKNYALALSEIAEQAQINNKEALNSNGLLTKSFANYVPQLVDQLKYEAAGAAIGLAATQSLQGAKAGAAAGSGLYSFNNMRGAAFYTLISNGVDEETARKAASDEALISGMIEMADTFIDLSLILGSSAGKALLKGLGANGLVDKVAESGLKNAAGKAIDKFAAKSALNKVLVELGRYGLDVLGEGEEEALQEDISTANLRRVLSGDADLGPVDLAKKALQVTIDANLGNDPEAKASRREARIEGMKVAAVSSALGLGGTQLANTASNTVTGLNLQKGMSKAEKSETQKSLIESGLEAPEDTDDYRAAAKADKKYQKSGSLSNAEVGNLYNQNRYQQNVENAELNKASGKTIYDVTGVKKDAPGAEKKALDRLSKVFTNAESTLSKTDKLTNADKFNLNIAKRTMVSALDNSWYNGNEAQIRKLVDDVNKINKALGIEETVSVDKYIQPVQTEAPQTETPVQEAPQTEFVSQYETATTSNNITYPTVGKKKGDSYSFHKTYVEENSPLSRIIEDAPSEIADSYDTVSVDDNGVVTLTKYDDFNGSEAPVAVMQYKGTPMSNGEYKWSKVKNPNSVLVDKYNYVPSEYSDFDVEEARNYETYWKGLARQYGISYDPQRIENADYFNSIMDKIAEAQKAEQDNPQLPGEGEDVVDEIVDETGIVKGDIDETVDETVDETEEQKAEEPVSEEVEPVEEEAEDVESDDYIDDEYSDREYEDEEETERNIGKSGVTYADNETPIRFRYEVVNADELITSNEPDGRVNPLYPKELQPRDRTRVSSTMQIEAMSKSLNPSLLAESPLAQNGAPLVLEDGTVISGNGRASAIRLAHENGTSGEYINYISANADKFGVSNDIPENAVLVRVIEGVGNDEDWEDNLAELARKLNENTISSLSSTEQAMADAERMGDILNYLVADEEGNINTTENAPFIQAFMRDVVSENDRAGLLTSDGTLNQSGLARVSNAIFAKAYQDSDLSEQLTESLDSNSKNVLNALLATSARAVGLKEGIKNDAYYDLDIVPDIVSGVKLYQSVTAQGLTMQQWLSQISLFNEYSDEAKMFAQFIEANKRSGKAIREFLNACYDEITTMGNPNQLSMFSMVGAKDNNDVTKADVIEQAGEKFESETGRSKGFERAADEKQDDAGSVEEDRKSDSETKGDDSSVGENGLAKSPQRTLAESVKAKLEKGEAFKSNDLWKLAEEAYGGTRGEGAYDVKSAYDGMELGINMFLMQSDEIRNANTDTAYEQALDYLNNLMQKVPTETVRTEEQQLYQQFSTPPTIAYVASWVANVNENDVVLEPSAGIGGLALFPKTWGATVYGNELSERRLKFLNELGLDGTFNEDAENINDVLPYEIKPTLVIMNPPFSSTAGRMKSNNTKYAKAHIEQALKRLEDGGRLVAILGRGMAEDTSFKTWWNELRKTYDIRANIGIDGKNYTKYGTNFDIRLVVIDKTGSQADVSTTLNGEFTSLNDACKALEGVRNDRVSDNTETEQGAAVKNGKGTSERPESKRPVSDTSGSAGVGGRAGQSTPKSADNVSDVRRPNGNGTVDTGLSGSDTVGDSDGGRMGGNGKRPSSRTNGVRKGGQVGSSSGESILQSVGEGHSSDIEKPKPGMTRAEYEAWVEEQKKKLLKKMQSALSGEQSKKPSKPNRNNTAYGNHTNTLGAINEINPAASNAVIDAVNELKANDEAQYNNLVNYLNNAITNGNVEAKGAKVSKPKSNSIHMFAEPYSPVMASNKEFADMVMQAFYNDREGLRAVAPDLVSSLEEQGFADYDFLFKPYDEYANENGIAEDVTDETQVDNADSEIETEEQTESNKLEAEETENTESVYSTYKPSSVKVKGAVTHPAKLVESAAMAAIKAPSTNYKPSIPNNLITSGALSDAQLENIILAGEAHSHILENGTRKGYFIGDGTGVGKGRQISGIILDNWNKGRKKAVWVTAKKNLYSDARRDWGDLGMDPDQIIPQWGTPNAKPIKQSEGILVTPYTTFSAGVENKSKRGSRKSTPKKDKGRPRIDQITEWLGDDFDGVIVFDESHEMGNTTTNAYVAGTQLQEKYPNARVVYASATGATELENLSYLHRLGLWGSGTAFPNGVREFIGKIERGGIAAMEFVAQSMKASGTYLARSISYDNVKYSTLQHELTPMQTDIYNRMSDAWQIVLQNINKALEVTGMGMNGTAKGKVYSKFWSSQQRFFNQILTSMSMPSVIADMERRLEEGKSCVIQLVNTNEAQQERAITKNSKEGKSLDELDLTPSEELINMVKTAFPIEVYEKELGQDGKYHVTQKTDSQGNPVISREAVEMRDKLIEDLQNMRVPEGPIEMILNYFGADNVAEITGRQRRIVEVRDIDGSFKKVSQDRKKDSIREAEANDFQNGNKRILIFSEAGGTGKSYHADRRAKNQQQRIHYVVQPGWSANKAVQGFGRTHRSNQSSAPEFVLVTTNVLGQKRFTSTIARRLDQLGALTKGQRQTGSGMFGERDNLENPIARNALAEYYRRADINTLKKIGLYDKVYDKDGMLLAESENMRKTSMFLNRILCLNVDEQNENFEMFYQIFNEMLDKQIANGEVDMGLQNVKADRIEVVEEKTAAKLADGSEVKYVKISAQNKATFYNYGSLKNLRKGTFKKIVRRKSDGAILAVYNTGLKTNVRTGAIETAYTLVHPQMQANESKYVGDSLKNLTEDIPKSEWENEWKAEIDNSPEYAGNDIHLLTGNLLAVWDRLPESNVKIKRVIASDGTQYLGRELKSGYELDKTLAELGVVSTTDYKNMTTAQVKDKILIDNCAVELRGGDNYKLQRRRVGNENRIELTATNSWGLGYIDGLIKERIQSQDRFFVPNNADGDKIIGALVSRYKIKSIYVANSEMDSSNDVQYYRESAFKKDIDGNNGNAPKPQINHAEDWRTTLNEGNTEEATSWSDIVEKIEHEYGINITNGHIRGQVRGLYNTKTNGIRSKITNDIPAISHELGHHFDNMYSITDDVEGKALDELIDNLEAKYKDTKHGGYPEELWPSEGFAEYIRNFLTNQDTAKIDYPEFTKYFFNHVSKKDYARIVNLGNQINATLVENETSAASTIRERGDKLPDSRTRTEKIKDFLDLAYQRNIDEMHGIKIFDNETGANVYKSAINSAYSGAIAAQVLKGDIWRNGEYVAPGIKTALSKINIADKTEYRALGEYLKCKHGIERLAEGKRTFASDIQNSKTWMQKRADELEKKYPHFKETADMLYEYRHNIVQTFGVDSGLISAETLKEWENRYKYYVPFYRVVEKKSNGRRASKGFVNQTSPVLAAYGSGRDTWNPVDNLIELTINLVRASTLNDVGVKLTNAAKEFNASAELIEKIPAPMTRDAFVMADFKAHLEHEVANSGMSAEDMDIMGDIINSINDVIYQYGVGKPHGNVISVSKNGHKEFWQINDPLLLESVANLKPATLDGVLKAYGDISKFMTQNITGLNVVWSISKNLVMDFQTLLTFSKTKNGLKLLRNIADSYVQTVKNAANGNPDPMYLEYLSMGGGSDSVYSIDKDAAEIARGKLEKDKSRYNPFNWLAFVSDIIETGPRYATYQYCRSIGLTPEEAMYEAHDITVNFARGGRNARIVNKFIPFFNSGVQSLDKFARYMMADDIPKTNIEARRKASITRLSLWVASTAIIGALVYGFNHRDPETEKDYEHLSNYTKNTYYNFGLGNGKFLSIPKARELSVITSLVERLLEANKNEFAFDEFGDYVTDNFLPNGIAEMVQGDWNGAIGSLGIIGTFHYLSSNKDFLGKPIVSNALAKKPAEEQYDRTTSKIAMWMGQAFKVSPKKLDFFFKNTLGGFWKVNQALLPVGSENRDWALGVGRTWTKDSLYSTDITNRLYDLAEESETKANSEKATAEDKMTKAMDEKMTTFYSTFNGLTRDREETETLRTLREAVLEDIDDYVKDRRDDYQSDTLKFIYKVADGDTGLLPSTMQKTITKSDKSVVELTAEQYYKYQTTYLANYYDLIEKTCNKQTSNELGAKFIKAAKDVAKASAEASIVGKENVAYFDDYKELTDEQVLRYKTSLDVLNDDGSTASYDKVKSVYDIGMSRQKSYTTLQALGLSDAANIYSDRYADVPLDVALKYQELTAAKRKEKGKSSLKNEEKQAILDGMNCDLHYKYLIWEANSTAKTDKTNPYRKYK